jgi:hypothetical protein
MNAPELVGHQRAQIPAMSSFVNGQVSHGHGVRREALLIRVEVRDLRR